MCIKQCYRRINKSVAIVITAVVVELVVVVVVVAVVVVVVKKPTNLANLLCTVC